jgi:hypothetical protein
LRAHSDAGLDRFAAGQSGHLQDHRIEVDDLLPGWRFFDERPDPVDDDAASIGVVHNAGERIGVVHNASERTSEAIIERSFLKC